MAKYRRYGRRVAAKCYIVCRASAGMTSLSTITAARNHGAGEPPSYLRSFGGLEQCASAIEDMLGGDPGNQISMLLLMSEGDVVEAIRRAGPKVEIEKIGGDPPNTTVSLRVTGSSEDKSGRLLVVQAGSPQIHLVVTHEGPAFVRTLPTVLGRMHPYAFVPYFSSKEIQSMLEMLESKTGLTLTTMRITSHRRIDKKISYVRKAKKLKVSVDHKESEITFTGVPYKESIESAVENDQWIDKAQFVLSENEDVRLEGYLSRSGPFKFRHSFLIFKKHVLPYVISLAMEKFRMYSNRSREDNDGEVSPLVIKLESGMFDDRKQNRRFIKAMQGMKYTSSGIYHANPYVNMSLVDHMDGSTFEIWVMSPDTITIVPQLRATQASLSRLVAHIFEKFQEGKVLEYEQ